MRPPKGQSTVWRVLECSSIRYPRCHQLQSKAGVLYAQEAHKGAHYRKIQQAWSNVVRKGAAWRTRSCGISPSYRIWLQNRVKLVGLPWGRILPQEPEAQSYEVQETLEVGKLKVTLEQVEAERKDLKRRLKMAMEEVHRERQLNDETVKRAQVERETRLKVGSCLRVADKEMCARRVERDQVAIEKEQLEKTLLNIKIREVEQKEQFRQLQERMHLLEEELARANLSKECLIDQRHKSVLQSFWRDRFLKLAWLANQALRDIPRSLQAAEGMADFVKTPKEISRFLGLCSELYDKIKAMATRLKKGGDHALFF
ncbi:hypothetical protein CR513_17760, partial [Mucuna pruriens]